MKRFSMKCLEEKDDEDSHSVSSSSPSVQDITHLDEEDDDEAEEETRKVTVASAKKKGKLLTPWIPLGKPKHCSEGRDYLSKYPHCREIFDFYIELQESTSGSNWKGKCLCCGKSRVGATSRLFTHYLNDECLLSLVPEDECEGLMEHLKDLSERRASKYGRNGAKAKASRAPNANDLEGYNVSTWLTNSRRARRACYKKLRSFLSRAISQRRWVNSPPFERSCTKSRGENSRLARWR